MSMFELRECENCAIGYGGEGNDVCLGCDDTSAWRPDTHTAEIIDDSTICDGCQDIQKCHDCSFSFPLETKPESTIDPAVCESMPSGDDDYQVSEINGAKATEVIVDDFDPFSEEYLEGIPEVDTATNDEYVDPDGLDAHEPGCKLDAGKKRWDLCPWEEIEGMVDILTFGANKYTDNGWKSVKNARARYMAALIRHWRQIESGETHDQESGEPHWKHMLCNAVFLAWKYNQDLK